MLCWHEGCHAITAARHVAEPSLLAALWTNCHLLLCDIYQVDKLPQFSICLRFFLPPLVSLTHSSRAKRAKDPEHSAKLWEAQHESAADQMHRVLCELRGFYLKLGQILASKTDMLPIQYTKSLSRLHDKMPAASFREVCKGSKVRSKTVWGELISEKICRFRAAWSESSEDLWSHSSLSWIPSPLLLQPLHRCGDVILP